jgi:lipoprotein-anchoring transpeptidase ErfK/SrfK
MRLYLPLLALLSLAPIAQAQNLPAPLPALAPEPLNISAETAQTRPNTAVALQAHISPHQVFGSKLTPVLISGNGEVQVLLNGKVVHATTLTAGQPHLLPALPLGPGQHRLQLRQPQGQQQSPVYAFYSLGIEPPDHTYLIVDKYNFTLYEVKHQRLAHIYPIATGRPRTPTQPGLWLVGQKEHMPATSDWGARRMKIFREHQYQSHWSGYAIHGTNRPTSIGSEASHGCVRMFNEDVSKLFERTALGTPVVIVEKLKVYVDKVGAPARKDEDQQ